MDGLSGKVYHCSQGLVREQNLVVGKGRARRQAAPRGGSPYAGVGSRVPSAGYFTEVCSHDSGVVLLQPSFQVDIDSCNGPVHFLPGSPSLLWGSGGGCRPLPSLGSKCVHTHPSVWPLFGSRSNSLRWSLEIIVL